MDLFGRFRKLDSSLQRGLDNGLARVFGGEVVPTEIDELLKQQAEDAVMTDNYGQQLAPCYYTVLVSQDDHNSLIDDRPNLEADLADRLTRFIRNNGWTTSSPVAVDIEAHSNLHSGQLRARSLFSEPERRPSRSTSSHADAPSLSDHVSSRGQQGGTPDGDYPDSYPGEQIQSPAQWPQRESDGQREATAREYDAHDVNSPERKSADEPATGHNLVDDDSADHVYEDTVFSEASFREPEREADLGHDDGHKLSNAGNPENDSPNSTSGTDLGNGNRGLADIVRPNSAAGASAAGSSGAAVAASAIGKNSNESADSGAAMNNDLGRNGERGGVDGENSPATGQQDAQQPSYPGTEIIAQSAPDTPVNGGQGFSDQGSDVHVTLHLRDGSDRKYRLQEGSNLIGRGNGVDLRIPDTGVSRQHADIVWDGYDAVLTDLHSTNGTTVNDTPVENWLLADGDLIVVGHSEILVHFVRD